MRYRTLPRLATGRVVALVTLAGLVTALLGASPAIASAAHSHPGPPAVPGPGRTLAQAPAGLRAAVHRALGHSVTPAASSSQQAKLTASDGASTDFFGFSAAISGSTAVVGAYGNNTNTGAAYVFTRSGTTWTQQAKLTASDGGQGDQFGASVALAGTTLVVGAPFGSSGSGTGAAYVFTRSGTTWTQQARLTASDGVAGDEFGRSVAVAGSTAVIGAYAANSNTGTAYVFTRSGTTWTQQAELTASDPATSNNFGYSVSISASTVVIGGYGNTSFTGAAYVFTRSGTTWTQQARLTASDAAAGDDFGSSVAVSGSTAVVGAPRKNSFTGAAYVFTQSGTTWTQQAKLTAADGAANDHFGSSVAISGGTAVVGAVGKNTAAGAVYAFARSGTAWYQSSELTASDAAAGDLLGSSVAVSQSTVLAGAYGKNSTTGAAYLFVLPSQQATLIPSDGAAREQFGDSVSIYGSTAVVGADGQNTGTGEAYVFVRSGTAWSLQAMLTASDGAAADEFGYSVAISGSTLVVGALARNSGAGAAYVFTRSGATWTQQAELTASDAANSNFFGNSVAIYGSTLVVGSYGSNSGAGAVYVFTGSGATWTQQAELTASDGAMNDHFGASVASYGSRVLAGAYGHNSTGAAYVFLRTGTTWALQAELTASDPGTFDDFGVSVSLTGTTAVVGAHEKNSFTGAAYVYVRSGTTWTQQAKLTASDAASGDIFGYSVSISGSTLAVAAPNKNSGAGVVYVFTRSGTTWTQQAELASADGGANNQFGSSVSLYRSTLVAGAPGELGVSTVVGTAYVFAHV